MTRGVKRPLPGDAVDEQRLAPGGAGGPDSDSKELKALKRRVKHHATQYKLTSDEEYRLGPHASTASWLIKVAQGRGGKASIMIQNLLSSETNKDVWTMGVQTTDAQCLTLVLRGPWVRQAASAFRRDGDLIHHHPFLLSGLGANLTESPDKVAFSSNECTMRILDLSSFELGDEQLSNHGYLAVSNGRIVAHPNASLVTVNDAGNAAATHLSVPPAQVPRRPKQEDTAMTEVRPIPQRRAFEEDDEDINGTLPIKWAQPSVLPPMHSRTRSPSAATFPSSPSVRNEAGVTGRYDSRHIDRSSSAARSSSPSASHAPSWLGTPSSSRSLAADIPSPQPPVRRESADVRGNDYTGPRRNAPTAAAAAESHPTVSRMSSVETASAMDDGSSLTKKQQKEAAKAGQSVRLIGGRFGGTYTITPINLMEPSQVTLYSTLGVVTSGDDRITRASGGTGDWFVTVQMRDVYPLNKPSPPARCMMFATSEAVLPSCQTGDILAVHRCKVRDFNGNVQMVGYKEKVEWVKLEASSGKVSYASPTCQTGFGKQILPEMQAQLQAIQRAGDKGKGVLETKGRKITTIEEIQEQVFFDTNVKVLRVWDGDRLPIVSVTDYTVHPKLHRSNDVLLNGFDAGELLQMSDEQGPGHGRVLQIYLWDDARAAMHQVEAGQYLRICNIRPKLGKSGFLEGNLARAFGSGFDKFGVKLFQLDDQEPAVRAIEERRKAYVKEVAQVRARHARLLNDKPSRLVPSAAVRPDEEMAQVDVDREFAEINASYDAEQLERMALTQHRSQQVETDMSRPYDPLAAFASLDVPSGQLPVMSSSSNITIGDTYEYTRGTDGIQQTPPSVGCKKVRWPVELTPEFEQLPVTRFDDVLSCIPDLPGLSDVFRCQVRITGKSRPAAIKDWTEIWCKGCEREVPANESTCRSCASMDDDQLEYRFRLNLMFCDAGRVDSLIPLTARQRTLRQQPVVSFSGENAQQFFGVDAKTLRCNEKERHRLAKRIKVIFGQERELALIGAENKDSDEDSDDSDEEEQEELEKHRESFHVGIRVERLIDNEAGKPQCRFHIEGCQLSKLSKSEAKKEVKREVKEEH